MNISPERIQTIVLDGAYIARRDSRQVCYVAGPMRGYPKFNFPAFDAAENRLTKLGFKVLSPASMDRELGFDENSTPFTKEDLIACVRRDIEAIIQCDVLILLEGWEKSVGASAEVAVAKWLGKQIKLYKDYADI